MWREKRDHPAFDTGDSVKNGDGVPFPSSRDTATSLRTPTTLSLDTALFTTADYYGGVRERSGFRYACIERRQRGFSHRQGKFYPFEKNAPYRGVQRETVIICIQNVASSRIFAALCHVDRLIANLQRSASHQ